LTPEQALYLSIKNAAIQYGIERKREIDPATMYRLHYERGVNHPEPVARNAREIMAMVAKFRGFTVNDLKSEARNSALVEARHESMWFCARDTKLSYPAIGRIHGDRDHTTVINAVRRMNAKFGENVRNAGAKHRAAQ
jgi:chromosomal replication initiation ATPase DnaA